MSMMRVSYTSPLCSFPSDLIHPPPSVSGPSRYAFTTLPHPSLHDKKVAGLAAVPGDSYQLPHISLCTAHWKLFKRVFATPTKQPALVITS
jgi:hypothetical protein